MKKYFLPFIIMAFLTAFSPISAQKAIITFEEKVHDFGKIQEDGGKVSYNFIFKNEGNSPLVISRVQASCGCTTPVWTKSPIEPGKTGSITVTYNPLGRPGIFNKTITVFSNATEERVQLTIKGEVIPGKKNDNEEYPISIEGIRLKNKIVQMNNITKGTIQTREVPFFNSTSQKIKVSIEGLPYYITANIIPEIVPPQENGKIIFSLDSRNCQQWGPISEDAYLVVNRQKKFSEDNKLLIFANIVEDFSKLTVEEKQNAPIISISTLTLSFGNLKFGDKKSGSFIIQNIGKNPLEIRRIINNNKELKIYPVKSVGGGKKAQLKVEVDTKNLLPGEYRKSFTLQTNDPDNSFIILTTTWTISK